MSIPSVKDNYIYNTFDPYEMDKELLNNIYQTCPPNSWENASLFIEQVDLSKIDVWAVCEWYGDLKDLNEKKYLLLVIIQKYSQINDWKNALIFAQKFVNEESAYSIDPETFSKAFDSFLSAIDIAYDTTHRESALNLFVQLLKLCQDFEHSQACSLKMVQLLFARSGFRLEEFMHSLKSIEKNNSLSCFSFSVLAYLMKRDHSPLQPSLNLLQVYDNLPLSNETLRFLALGNIIIFLSNSKHEHVEIIKNHTISFNAPLKSYLENLCRAASDSRKATIDLLPVINVLENTNFYGDFIFTTLFKQMLAVNQIESMLLSGKLLKPELLGKILFDHVVKLLHAEENAKPVLQTPSKPVFKVPSKPVAQIPSNIVQLNSPLISVPSDNGRKIVRAQRSLPPSNLVIPSLPISPPPSSNITIPKVDNIDLKSSVKSLALFIKNNPASIPSLQGLLIREYGQSLISTIFKIGDVNTNDSEFQCHIYLQNLLSQSSDRISYILNRMKGGFAGIFFGGDKGLFYHYHKILIDLHDRENNFKESFSLWVNTIKNSPKFNSDDFETFLKQFVFSIFNGKMYSPPFVEIIVSHLTRNEDKAEVLIHALQNIKDGNIDSTHFFYQLLMKVASGPEVFSPKLTKAIEGWKQNPPVIPEHPEEYWKSGQYDKVLNMMTDLFKKNHDENLCYSKIKEIINCIKPDHSLDKQVKIIFTLLKGIKSRKYVFNLIDQTIKKLPQQSVSELKKYFEYFQKDAHLGFFTFLLIEQALLEEDFQSAKELLDKSELMLEPHLRLLAASKILATEDSELYEYCKTMVNSKSFSEFKPYLLYLYQTIYVEDSVEIADPNAPLLLLKYFINAPVLPRAAEPMANDEKLLFIADFGNLHLELDDLTQEGNGHFIEIAEAYFSRDMNRIEETKKKFLEFIRPIEDQGRKTEISKQVEKSAPSKPSAQDVEMVDVEVVVSRGEVKRDKEIQLDINPNLFEVASREKLMSLGVVPLYNPSANCWANSLIQLIMAIPDLRNAFDNFVSVQKYELTDILWNSLKEYQNYYKNSQVVCNSSYQFRNAFSRITNGLISPQSYHQEDLLIALRMILSHSIETEVSSPFISHLKVVKEFAPLKTETKETAKSNQYSSLSVGNRYESTENLYEVILPLQSCSNMDFNEMFKNFLNPHVEGVTAQFLVGQGLLETFEQKKESKQFQKLPKAMLITLGRFGFSQHLNQSFKICDQVMMPLTFKLPAEASVSGQEAEYELVGFSSHLGATLNNGHYIAYIKKNGCWFMCNDANIYEITEKDIQNALKESGEHGFTSYAHIYILKDGKKVFTDTANSGSSSLV